MTDLPWLVVRQRMVNPYVHAAFVTEAAARDYTRWRNDGRRVWKVIHRTGGVES